MHTFILLWVGYFAAVGIADLVNSILSLAALQAGIYPGDTAIVCLYVTSVGAAGVMMIWITRTYAVFWSQAQHVRFELEDLYDRRGIRPRQRREQPTSDSHSVAVR